MQIAKQKINNNLNDNEDIFFNNHTEGLSTIENTLIKKIV